MASINTIVKRKQYLWLGIVVVGAASAIGGALYLSDVDMSGNGETVAEQEPVPDMTGVVDTTFDDKVRQHATTEMQVTAAQMQKQYEEIRRELDVLNKQRGDDQRRIEKLGQDNAALAEQVKALGANPVTATGEPVPQMPASPPGPEGEPQPGNTPVSFPPQGSVAVPPPTAFYPGNGVTPPPQVTYQSVPVPNRIQRKVFNGTYGQYFNSDEPSLRDDAKMVVLELGGLEDRPSLLVAVMFSLIIYIENRMYRTPRNLKKLNVIDEGWRLLDFKNHKVGEFIEKGYRTARRHTGAYITITQNIVDFDSDKASSAARAAWGNSSYKIILKQSAKEFAKYNQLYPDQFLPLQRDMIGKFGAAKDQWFSSFLLQVENHSSWHRLFVDPLSRAMYSSDGPDFEFVQQKRKEGLSIHEAVWQLAWKKSGPEMASLEAWLEEHEKYRSVA